MEIAWRCCGPGPDQPARRFLVAGDGRLSAVFSGMTGIRDGDMASAVPREEVSETFLEDCAEVGAVVAHTLRYEARLLGSLPRVGPALEAGRRFCTAEIARRLLPGLSGFGLRAVAGYLGFPLGELRSALSHVEATAMIWRTLTCGMPSLEALQEILDSRPPEAGERLDRLPEGWRERLPGGPGVYRLQDCAGRDLYVGKASSLRRRVPQHFQGCNWRSKDGMTSSICRIETTPCETALEAALLEAGLIESLRPPCNRALASAPPEVVWLSRDLGGTSPVRTAETPLGPHAIQGPMRDLSLLSSAISSGSGAELTASCRWLAAFEPAEMDEALGLLSTRYPGSGSPRALLEVAARIQPPGPSEEADALQALLWILVSAGAAGRRARWFRLLACSEVSWREGSRRRVLPVCTGTVTCARWECGDGSPCDSPSEPAGRSGCGPGLCRGAAGIDAAGFRRLSILSSGIGEMLRRGMDMRVVPASTALPLHRAALAKIYERLRIGEAQQSSSSESSPSPGPPRGSASSSMSSPSSSCQDQASSGPENPSSEEALSPSSRSPSSSSSS